MDPKQYDIIYSQVYASTVNATITQPIAQMSAVVTKIQASLDSALGIGTVTIVISKGTIPMQEITLTPGSPTYVEQEYKYGVLRISPTQPLVVSTKGGSASVTIGYYFAYGRSSTS